MWKQENIKELKRRILARVLPFFLVWLIRFLAFFVRFEFRLSQQALDRLSNHESFIIALWHGELLFQPFIFQRYMRDKRLWVVISKHFDGQIISGVNRYFGIDTISGSSSKGGARALYHAIRKIEHRAYVAITPDGPRGPYHSVADGVVLLSQKTKAPIVVSRVFFSNAWELKSWDRFKIPKPFSRILLVFGDPFWVESLEISEAKALVKEKMEEDICGF